MVGVLTRTEVVQALRLIYGDRLNVVAEAELETA